jgi:septal ring factor EnvC (AmiA/AmiB activator)
MSKATTRRLTSASLELVSEARTRARLRVTLVTVLLALSAFVAARLLTGDEIASSRDRLYQENTELRATVARLTAELELEQATRAALDRQVTELNQRSTELERQLAFVQAQKVAARR